MRRKVIIVLIVFVFGFASFAFSEDDYARLERIGSQMNSVMGANYKFSTIGSNDLNAYYRNGSVQVTSKLLGLLNDDSLALILAHEIAHGVGKHQAHQKGGGLLWGLLGAGASALCHGDKQAIANTFALGYVAGSNSYSRADEYRADEMAMNAVMKAGYDPERAIEGFYTLKQKYGDGLGAVPVLSILASHPPTSSRIARLESQAKNDVSNDCVAQNNHREVPLVRIAIVEIEPRYISTRLASELKNRGARVTLTGGNLYGKVIGNQQLTGFNPSTMPRQNKLWGNTHLVYPELKISYPSGTNSNSNVGYNGYGTYNYSSNSTRSVVLNLQIIDSETGDMIDTVSSGRNVNTNICRQNSISVPGFSINTGGGGYDNGEIPQEILDGIIIEAANGLMGRFSASCDYSQYSGQSIQEEKICATSEENVNFTPSVPDITIYSSRNSIVEITVGNIQKKSRITNPEGILRVYNIGDNKYVKIKMNNRDYSGYTPCKIYEIK